MQTFSVTTNEFRGGNGERTEYHACVAWDRLAEICGQFLSKGQLVDVTIDLHVDFASGETFTAEGFCPSGTAESFDHLIVGAGRATTFHLFKTLTCDDGSGTLTIRVNAAGVFGFPGTIGGWNVVGGSGDYAATRGGGHIVGTGFEGGIDDHYTGRLTQ